MVDYLILILLHLVGDFYLQTTKIAQCKNARKSYTCGKCKKCKDNSWINIRYLLIHSLLYAIPFVTLCFITDYIYTTVVMAILLVTHILIDIVTCYFNKRFKQTLVFILDQAIHIGIICFIPRFLIFKHNLNDYYGLLKVIFVCLMLIMPSSVMISKLIKDIYPNTEDMGVFDIGSMIGIMERFLAVIFAYFNNFPAIAIIITVKTWARTNDLKEPEFRNKYLLGTLTSLVLALLIFIVYELL